MNAETTTVVNDSTATRYASQTTPQRVNGSDYVTRHSRVYTPPHSHSHNNVPSTNTPANQSSHHSNKRSHNGSGNATLGGSVSSSGKKRNKGRRAQIDVSHLVAFDFDDSNSPQRQTSDGMKESTAHSTDVTNHNNGGVPLSGGLSAHFDYADDYAQYDAEITDLQSITENYNLSNSSARRIAKSLKSNAYQKQSKSSIMDATIVSHSDRISPVNNGTLSGNAPLNKTSFDHRSRVKKDKDFLSQKCNFILDASMRGVIENPSLLSSPDHRYTNAKSYSMQILSRPYPDLPWQSILRINVRKYDNNSFRCPICLNEEFFVGRMTPCGHLFCGSCLLHYLFDAQSQIFDTTFVNRQLSVTLSTPTVSTPMDNGVTLDYDAAVNVSSSEERNSQSNDSDSANQRRHARNHNRNRSRNRNHNRREQNSGDNNDMPDDAPSMKRLQRSTTDEECNAEFWRDIRGKCPLCQKSFYFQQCRPTNISEVKQWSVGDTIDMVLLRRKRGSEETVAVGNPSLNLNLNEEKSSIDAGIDLDISRFERFSIVDLNAEISICDTQIRYIQSLIQSLPPNDKYDKPYLLALQSHVSQLKAYIIEQNSNASSASSALASATISTTQRSDLQLKYNYVYQSCDGQYIVLDPFNWNMLRSEYIYRRYSADNNEMSASSSRYEASPKSDDRMIESMLPQIIGGAQILQIEKFTFTQHLKPRYGWLSGILPLNTDFSFVELDLRSFLSPPVFNEYRKEFERRMLNRQRSQTLQMAEAKRDSENEACRIAQLKAKHTRPPKAHFTSKTSFPSLPSLRSQSLTTAATVITMNESSPSPTLFGNAAANHSYSNAAAAINADTGMNVPPTNTNPLSVKIGTSTTTTENATVPRPQRKRKRNRGGKNHRRKTKQSNNATNQS